VQTHEDQFVDVATTVLSFLSSLLGTRLVSLSVPLSSAPGRRRTPRGTRGSRGRKSKKEQKQPPAPRGFGSNQIVKSAAAVSFPLKKSVSWPLEEKLQTVFSFEVTEHPMTSSPCSSSFLHRRRQHDQRTFIPVSSLPPFDEQPPEPHISDSVDEPQVCPQATGRAASTSAEDRSSHFPANPCLPVSPTTHPSTLASTLMPALNSDQHGATLTTIPSKSNIPSATGREHHLTSAKETVSASSDAGTVKSSSRHASAETLSPDPVSNDATAEDKPFSPEGVTPSFNECVPCTSSEVGDAPFKAGDDSSSRVSQAKKNKVNAQKKAARKAMRKQLQADAAREEPTLPAPARTCFLPLSQESGQEEEPPAQCHICRRNDSRRVRLERRSQKDSSGAITGWIWQCCRGGCSEPEEATLCQGCRRLGCQGGCSRYS